MSTTATNNTPSPRTMAWIFGGLALLAVAMFPVLFEQVEEEIDVGPSGMARANAWHALDLTLDELGVPTVSRYGIGELPPTDHVLVVLSTDQGTRGGLWERALSWAESGGHLVIVATVGGGTDDLEDTGIVDTGTVDTGVLDDTPEEPDVLAAFGLYGTPIRESGTHVSTPSGGQRQLDIAPTRAVAAWYELGHVWSTADGHAWAARLPVGDGLMTVLADASPFANGKLGAADHAPLAWEILVSGAQVPAGAVLVLSGDDRSLLGILWRHASSLLIAFCALAGVLAWRGAVRVAPPLPPPSPDRRDLMEHVAATGAYLWRHDLHDDLLDPARAAVSRRLGLRGDTRQALDAQVDTLLTNLPADGPDAADLRSALIDPAPSNPGAFLAAVRALQTLWSPR